MKPFTQMWKSSETFDESGNIVRSDIIGVLHDGRPFWAWGSYLETEGVEDFLRHYLQHPEENTEEKGAMAFDSVEAMREALRRANREDLIPATEAPDFLQRIGKTFGNE